LKLEETIIEDTVTNEEVRSFFILLSNFYLSGELGECIFLKGPIELDEYFESMDIYSDDDLLHWHWVRYTKCNKEKFRFLGEFLEHENQFWDNVLGELITEFWTYHKGEEWSLLDYLFDKELEDCECYHCVRDKRHREEKKTLREKVTYLDKLNRENIAYYRGQKYNTLTKSKSPQKCYILKDKSNDTYKIGCSKNPLQREKTLQSEKPDLELIKVFEKNHEKELHKKYAEQCVRGEWFKLTPVQVKYICTHYK
jgi:hypothetical protein